MKFKAIVQNVVDSSYDSKKQGKHVDRRDVHVVEIGADALVGSMRFSMAPEDVKVKAGDECDVICRGVRVWAGAIEFEGVIAPVKK